MSDVWGPPYSNNPYAPQIPSWEYMGEKMNFAGFLIGAICYGIVITLFFQCMGALLNPVHRTRGGGIMWALVTHTVAMFVFVTIFTALNLDLQSVSYIDNRNFPGDDMMYPPGPFGYQVFVFYKAITVAPTIMFHLNTCLADGLLLYRCWVTYARNYWVIAFPCLMFLASFAMGIVFIWQVSRPISLYSNSVTVANFGTPYFAISISLNVLLTLMIVTRLILHSRSIRKVMGDSGFYKTAVTMLVESCALYAVSYIAFIAPWAIGSPVTNIFFPILAETQVIAPFLITLRVANQTALTSDTIVQGKASSLHFGTRRDSMGEGTISVSVGHPTSSMEVHGKAHGERSVGVMTTIDLDRDSV